MRCTLPAILVALVVLAGCGDDDIGGPQGVCVDPEPGNMGYVNFHTYYNSNEDSWSSGIVTYYDRLAQVGTKTGCQSRRIGPCVVERYSPENGGEPDKHERASAGSIEIMGGHSVVLLEPYLNGRYEWDYHSLFPNEPLWEDGATLMVEASGREVPRFFGTIATVRPVHVSAPAKKAVSGASGGGVSDVEFGWPRSGSGQVSSS